MGKDKQLAVESASAVVVLTEWDGFRSYDWQGLRAAMAEEARVFDFRCYLDRQLLSKHFDAAF